MRLKQKHSNTQEDWLRAWDDPYASGLTEEKLEQLEQEAIRFIKDESEGSVLCGHSGGKDSLVLYDLYKRAGYSKGIYATSRWEFPSFIDYRQREFTDDIKILMSDKDYDWLVKRGEPFVRTADGLMDYHRILNTNPINRYLDKHEVDTYVVGRRWADGNNIPKSKIRYRGKHKTKVIHPIADWSHEAILAYIQKHDIELPSMYFMESSGFDNGTNVWPMMNIYDRPIEEQWRLMWKDEPKIVIEASKYYDGARLIIEENIIKQMEGRL